MDARNANVPTSVRKHIAGTEPLDDGLGTVVKAVVPQAELHLYATKLQSITHGHGSVRYRFQGFEMMPAEAAQKVPVKGHATPE